MEEYENGDFTRKTLKFFSVPDTTPKKFKNGTTNGHFGFTFRKTRAGKSHDSRDVVVFEKLRLQNLFRPREHKAGVFKFLRFEESFGKAPFFVPD